MRVIIGQRLPSHASCSRETGRRAHATSHRFTLEHFRPIDRIVQRRRTKQGKTPCRSRLGQRRGFTLCNLVTKRSRPPLARPFLCPPDTYGSFDLATACPRPIGHTSACLRQAQGWHWEKTV